MHKTLHYDVLNRIVYKRELSRCSTRTVIHVHVLGHKIGFINNLSYGVSSKKVERGCRSEKKIMSTLGRGCLHVRAMLTISGTNGSVAKS